jgi:hypothetical protein
VVVDRDIVVVEVVVIYAVFIVRCVATSAQGTKFMSLPCDAGPLVLVMGDPYCFVGGSLGEALSVELKNLVLLSHHEEATNLLRRRILAGDLGDALEDGRIGLLED